MAGPLSSRVALVTGASRGIGRAIAIALAKAGADLALTSTREGGADGTLQEIAALNRSAFAVSCDVSCPDQVERVVELTGRELGPVEVLVNNAGTIHRGPLAQTTEADLDRVLGVNLSGPFYLIRRLVPAMVKRGFGRVVNVSSISGTLGTAGLSAYCASKWGLNGLTRALSVELRGTGVCIMAVLPGSVDTDMLKGSGFEPDMTAEEVARVVRFLCGEAPPAMNGSLVEVFG